MSMTQLQTNKNIIGFYKGQFRAWRMMLKEVKVDTRYPEWYENRIKHVLAMFRLKIKT